MSKIIKNAKTILTKIAKKSKAFRSILRFGMNALRLLRYKLDTIGEGVDSKTIIFACFDGKSYACSPKAIYEYMASDERFSDYTFVWAFKDVDKYKDYFSGQKSTILVKYGSKAHRKYIARAKYWVFNFKIGEYLKPKKNQVFVQCWHGTPLKRLGCDLTHFDNVMNTIDGMRKRYHIEAEKFDYFISPSEFASEKFISAWDLKSIDKENIIVEEGYPRNDFLFNYTEADADNIRKEIFGIEHNQIIGNKKIILYAPTYRSNQHNAGLGYTYQLNADFDYWREKLGEDYIILFRPHYFIANEFDFEKYNGFVYDASKIDDINLLYIISDILITDYSSVFFDYANLKRPMIFYMYDLEHYRDESNGFYIDIEKELPGRIVKTDAELIDEIINVSSHFDYDEKYKHFNGKYNYLDDGKASERVVEKIFL